MATQPPTKPNRIDPQSPPETPGRPFEPLPEGPEESPELPPDFGDPGEMPDEQPSPL